MEEDDLSVGRRLRRLNLNAPILSTRRAGVSSPSTGARAHKRRSSSLDTTSKRIPFSWEQVPGTPKGVNVMNRCSNQMPPPKLPPCQWHPSQETSNGNDHDYDHDDVFSDAVDMFSLSESLDVVDSTSDSRRLSNLDEEIDSNGFFNHSPNNFIIRRFLPDANALASSSSSTSSCSYSYCPTSSIISRNVLPQLPVEECSVSRRSFSKACGIGGLFPWRMKHAVCGLKNPVRNGSQIVKVNGNARLSQSSS